ncbi:hypothetical protein HXX01_04255 [Candidatus Nomurabacteria bacterium]|nr:hypothetical protein [Candidatus Nomurabacteria bacterium]
MTWAAQRRLQYIGGLFLVFCIILFIFLYPIIFRKPTCFDGKQNGDETGVDCGGSCQLMCKEKISDPVILWSRAFPVVGNTYNLVAYIENQNKNSGVVEASYEFRVYDVKNLLIGRRQGTTFIPPNKQFAIFEPRIDFAQREVKSVSFEFTGPLTWVRKEPTLNNLSIFADKVTMGDDMNNPSLTAVIKNESIYEIPSFDVIAILYDENHNAINASKTVKESLPSNDSMPVFFTWPNALTGVPVIKDVLISINPFTVSF